MGLGLHEPRNWFNICAKNHPWSKLCNSTRLEAQIHHRLKVQRFVFVFTECITYGKNPLAVSVIHLHESRFSYFFQKK